MIRILFFGILLAVVLAAAFGFGDRETRVAASACVVASLLSAVLVTFRGTVEVGIAGVDLGVLALFVGIALRTERFWPLWVAGLQLTTVLGHLLRWLKPDLVDIAYAAAMRFWAYPILLIVLIAALRSQRCRTPNVLPSA